MIIKVKGFLTYKELIGRRELELVDDTPLLLDLLRQLAIEIGNEHGQMLFEEELDMARRSVAITLNGRHFDYLPNKLNTVLRDQDEVAIFPPGAGG